MVIKMPASCLEALKPPADRADGAAKAGNRGKTGTALHRPKKFLLAGETTKHKIVALVFDPRTEREAGFALSPKAAKDLAAGLVKSAENVSNYKPPQPN